LAGWPLGVHWQSLAGWRWLFILEGIPAVVVGTITYLYMTDRPVQALGFLRTNGTGSSRNCRRNYKRKTRFETLPSWRLLETHEF
jgi:sugar phosphate permease